MHPSQDRHDDSLLQDRDIQDGQALATEINSDPSVDELHEDTQDYRNGVAGAGHANGQPEAGSAADNHPEGQEANVAEAPALLPSSGGDLSCHEVANIYPPMTAEEFKALVEDIRRHGQLEMTAEKAGHAITTKRWCDPTGKADGFRLLVCRYRPRALPKKDETWDAWWPDLGPSRQLHADVYGKNRPPITWEEYISRYLEEMQGQTELIDKLALLVSEGRRITLLCSRACEDPKRCHRTLLRRLIEDRLGQVMKRDQARYQVTIGARSTPVDASPVPPEADVAPSGTEIAAQTQDQQPPVDAVAGTTQTAATALQATAATRRVTDLKPHPANERIYGDQDSADLIASISQLRCILEALLITHDNRIISGHRRWLAAKEAKLDEVPVVVFPSKDELDIAEALVHANKQRQKTNEQLGREAKELQRVEKERAKRRQQQAGKQFGRGKKLVEHVPPAVPRAGKSRDMIGEVLGVSGKQAEKAAAVVEAIDRLEEGGQRDEAKHLRQTLNEKSVSAAFTEAKASSDDPSVSRVSLIMLEEPTKYITLTRWETMSPAERHAVIEEAAGKEKFNDRGDDYTGWALRSWNPVTGCLHNCTYCYARDIANRFYKQKFEPTFHPSRLKAPHNTPFPTKKAEEWMGHKNVFVCSMADLFGRWVPKEWIEAVLAEVRKAPQWNFLFLTKFPIRMAEFEFPDNAWVGTTVDCQARVANAEKAFRKIKAGIKWLSIEPMLERLRFTDLDAFQWIVLGGASKSTQTPEWHPPRAWVNEIERQAAELGIPVYERDNLLSRIRQYPGVESNEPQEAPKALRYLPSKAESENDDPAQAIEQVKSSGAAPENLFETGQRQGERVELLERIANAQC